MTDWGLILKSPRPSFKVAICDLKRVVIYYCMQLWLYF